MRSLLVLASCVIPTMAQGRLPPAVTAVELRITDEKGGPIQTARVQLLGVMAGSTVFRAVPGQAPRQLAPKDFSGDYAVLGDLPAGEFVVRVDAELHALTLSEPFVLPAEKPARITVRMHRGATVTGVVTAPDGKPLADAEVSTESSMGGRNANPFVKLFANLMAPPTTTAARVRTGADGTFRIEHVARGNYRLVAVHEAFAPASCEFSVDAEGTHKAPPLALVAGAMVEGNVTRLGKPVAGVEVVLQSEPEEAKADQMPAIAVYLTATTDAQGNYRMPRVPFGLRYSISASERAEGMPFDVALGLAEPPDRPVPGISPFEKAKQIQATKRAVGLEENVPARVENLVLPVREGS